MHIDYPKTALLAIDIQNDFCPAYTGKDGKNNPAGSLMIKDGDKIIPPLNRIAKLLHTGGSRVLASQDWHPTGHVSFAASHAGKNIGDIVPLDVPEASIQEFNKRYPQLSDPVPAVIQQMLWPVHCVEGTPGADFHDTLETGYIDCVFRKGCHKTIDSYSVFFENDRCTSTELHAYLKDLSIDTLIIGGLATDYCVFYSAMDSLRLGYKTILLTDAAAGVGVPEGSIEQALKTMKDAGALFAVTGDFE
jgi:nicotinamidase/pyrazinamidase